MAFPTDTFTATDLAVMIPEIWGTKVNEFLRQKLNITGMFTDRSDELVAGGDTIHTPNTTEMTANAKSNATAVTLNSPTETKIDLVVDQWFETSFMIEDKEAVQVKQSYNLQQRYMKNAAFTTAKKLEVAIATLFASFTLSAGTAGAVLGDAGIREAIADLGNAGADFDEAVWFLNHKTVWVDVMAIDRFAISNNTAGAMNPVTKKQLPSLYGRPLVISGNIQTANAGVDYVGALATPDAIHYATASLPGAQSEFGVRLQANYIPEYLGTLCTADILFGSVLNRATGGVKILSKVAV